MKPSEMCLESWIVTHICTSYIKELFIQASLEYRMKLVMDEPLLEDLSGSSQPSQHLYPLVLWHRELRKCCPVLYSQGSCFSLSLSIPILNCHHTWCCCGIPSDFYCATQT
ncbi:hypothetical protein STEG23_009223, partial [Scotinomys teguina]